LLAVLVGKEDPCGGRRVRERDRGQALAGKSTLNRLGRTPARANATSRYQKIVAHLGARQPFFVKALGKQPLVPARRIALELDGTDLVRHGHQRGRFVHGYQDASC
jgi:hypothetical protein